ncbi:hypothetical protein [Mesorhizobium sp. A623]
MKSRGPYRRHSMQFKLQFCQNIRSGVIGWSFYSSVHLELVWSLFLRSK